MHSLALLFSSDVRRHRPLIFLFIFFNYQHCFFNFFKATNVTFQEKMTRKEREREDGKNLFAMKRASVIQQVGVYENFKTALFCFVELRRCFSQGHLPLRNAMSFFIASWWLAYYLEEGEFVAPRCTQRLQYTHYMEKRDYIEGNRAVHWIEHIIE